MFKATLAALAAVLVLGLGFSGCGRAKPDLVVYSARGQELIQPLFDAYHAETGVRIQAHSDKEGPLIQRLKAEGASSPADILITVDVGNLWQAQQEGLFEPLRSPLLEGRIPAHLRDPQGHWFGYSVRARTLVYHPGRVKPSELVGYADLAHPRWKGRLALRTSKKVYNQSLVAMFIAADGEAKTLAMLQGWVRNLVAEPFASDNQVMEAIAAGQGDVGLVNTYYYGRLLQKDPELPLKLFWADQKGRGVHVNVSGAGMLKSSRRKAEAQRFLEWLAGDTAQRLFADGNLEYPAAEGVSPAPAVAAWGAFKQDRQGLGQAGRLQARAIQLMDKAGYR
jgi:iron(III) transport system substrate-binding protein